MIILYKLYIYNYMVEKIGSYIFFRKSVLILIHIHDSKPNIYSSEIARKLDITFSHVIKMINNLERLKLVETNKFGRIKILNLTEKGKKCAEHLSNAKNILETKC